MDVDGLVDRDRMITSEWIFHQAREKQKRRAKDHQYISDEDQYEDDEWDHSQYKDLLRWKWHHVSLHHII